MNNKEIVTRWVNSVVDNGFMNGFGGDRSPSFKNEQIEYMLGVIDGKIEVGRHRLITHIMGDCANLKQYCHWTDEEITKLVSMFGFSNINQVNELYSKPPDYLKKVICNNKYIGEK